MPTDPAAAKIIAVDGGGFVRVCPLCGEQVEETSEQVEGTWITPDGSEGNVNDTDRLQNAGLTSYDTAVDHDGMADHLQEAHGDG